MVTGNVLVVYVKICEYLWFRNASLNFCVSQSKI